VTAHSVRTRSLSVRAALAQSGLVPLDAKVLLAHVLSCDRAWLAAHGADPLERAAADRFFELARQRREGMPVAYLTGTREFWSLPLEVTPDVLIPRPETETLVEAALERLPREGAPLVLDLGTGTGAIALALAHERPQAGVWAVDAAQAALQVAQDNARSLGISNVRFLLGDWYGALPPDATPFDVIVANPPYVAAADPHLAEGDVRHEPRAALVAGCDGLAALRVIVAGAPAHLRESGWLLVEHGHDQAQAVQSLFLAAGFVDLQALRDLAGIPRVALGRRAPAPARDAHAGAPASAEGSAEASAQNLCTKSPAEPLIGA
jgi:release factor glutamine methyltransferase